MTTPAFDPSRFLSDATALAEDLAAPWDPAVARRMLEAFAGHFSTGAVLWKTTSRPGDYLNYRFFARERDDVTATAVRARMVVPGPLTELTSLWGAKFGAEAI